MSEIRRYTVESYDSRRYYVLWEDHQDAVERLKAEVDRLLADNTRLTAERDKALDDIQTWQSVFPYIAPERLLPLKTEDTR